MRESRPECMSVCLMKSRRAGREAGALVARSSPRCNWDVRGRAGLWPLTPL